MKNMLFEKSNCLKNPTKALVQLIILSKILPVSSYPGLGAYRGTNFGQNSFKGGGPIEASYRKILFQNPPPFKPEQNSKQTLIEFFG
jgi:hypothetical protein